MQPSPPPIIPTPRREKLSSRILRIIVVIIVSIHVIPAILFLVIANLTDPPFRGSVESRAEKAVTQIKQLPHVKSVEPMDIKHSGGAITYYESASFIIASDDDLSDDQIIKLLQDANRIAESLINSPEYQYEQPYHKGNITMKSISPSTLKDLQKISSTLAALRDEIDHNMDNASADIYHTACKSYVNLLSVDTAKSAIFRPTNKACSSTSRLWNYSDSNRNHPVLLTFTTYRQNDDFSWIQFDKILPIVAQTKALNSMTIESEKNYPKAEGRLYRVEFAASKEKPNYGYSPTDIEKGITVNLTKITRNSKAETAISVGTMPMIVIDRHGNLSVKIEYASYAKEQAGQEVIDRVNAGS